LIGRTISHYEVVELLGEGGMGVVYKARDTQLNRFVALKTLPPGEGAEGRSRLLEEAQAASALNHPNIVTVHQVIRSDEGDFIVMELVSGRTLDRIIPRHGLPLGEALRIAVQVASALEAAHAAGIVHRDIKPRNVAVEGGGRVRVLDFGLATLTAGVGPDQDADLSALTTAAAVPAQGPAGTLRYMSPEQIQGHPPDARSDVFSFGVLLYEMLTGRRPFDGDSNASVVAAVLKQEPAPLPDDVPPELGRLVRRCLRKDPARRARHMDDVRLALEELKEDSDPGRLGAPSATTVTGRRATQRWGLAGLAATLLVVAGWALSSWGTREDRPAPREVPLTTEPGNEAMGRFSPDGSTVVFARWDADSLTGTLEAKVVGAEGSQVLVEADPEWPNVWGPSFSPDGRWIAFYARRLVFEEPTAIRVIPRVGGEARHVAAIRHMTFAETGVAWTPDGKWVVSQDRAEGEKAFHLALVSVETGERRRLTHPPPDVFGDSGAALSPDGRSLAFTRYAVFGASDLYTMPLDEAFAPAGEPRRLTGDGLQANAATWLPDGKELLFSSQHWHAATLWRVAAEGSTPPRPLGLGGRGAFAADVDATGSRLTYTKRVWDLNVWRLELLRSGLPAGPPQALLQSNLVDQNAVFSPDGRWIAFVSERSGAREVWLSDSSGERLRRLTSLDSAHQGMWSTPAWSSDGRWLAFDAIVGGDSEDVYVTDVESGATRPLTSDPGRDLDPTWSPDGRWVRFSSDRGGKEQIWKMPLEGGEPTLSEEQWRGTPDPDGVYGYFAEEGERGWSIRRRLLAGGPVEDVVSTAGNGVFAVTRRGVYFTQGDEPLSPRRIAFLDLDSGEVTPIVDLLPGTNTGSSLAVSPDERTLIYTQCDTETGDLMLVENFR